MLLGRGSVGYGKGLLLDFYSTSSRKGEMYTGSCIERACDGAVLPSIAVLRLIHQPVGISGPASGTSTSTKGTGRVVAGIAFALTVTDTPGDVNVVCGGQLDPRHGPAGTAGEQWQKRTTGVKGTMKEFVELMLGASASACFTRITPNGRCAPALVAPVLCSAPPVRLTSCGTGPSFSPARSHRANRQANRRRSDANGRRARTHHTTTEASGKERHQRSRYPAMEKRNSFFSTRSASLQGILRTVNWTAWHQASVSIKSLPLTEWLRSSTVSSVPA